MIKRGRPQATLLEEQGIPVSAHDIGGRRARMAMENVVRGLISMLESGDEERGHNPEKGQNN